MAHSSERTNLAAKPCEACGREITWRKKWARDWAHIRYCSDACRRASKSSLPDAIDAKILSMLRERADGATICPSEVARALEPNDWRPLMEPTRRAARRLAHRGDLLITQGGRPVDPQAIRGPIRLRLP